jgi:UDP-glucuronate 4-epimerase
MGHYLVTGSAGFIGSCVTSMLLGEGHMVTGVDNLNDAYDVRMKDYRLKQVAGRAGFNFQKLDISQRAFIDELTAQIAGLPDLDGVIHLAARAGVRQSVENPWVYVDTNITGTLNVLELCRQRAIPKLVMASTSSIYGAGAPLPTPEHASSDAPLQPYAASKKGAEALCHTYHFLYGIDVTIFRYFTVYGPAGRPDMVMFRFAQWISEGRPVRLNGDGRQTRGFTYVDDIARGTIQGLKPLGFEIINLGGHETISINDLIKMLEDLIGKKAQIEYLPFHPADMFANWADVGKARQLLGWTPRVPLLDGVTRLVNWYEAERDWACQIDTER